MPVTSTIFELENYTIDTGAYETPPDAGVIESGAVGWSWSDKEKSPLWSQMPSPKTFIGIFYYPLDDSNISKLSDNEYIEFYIQTGLIGGITAMDYLIDPLKPQEMDRFDNVEKNLSPEVVYKPYPGLIAASPNHPTFKVYVGAIDKFNFLMIASSESDERMALIMSELKVYPKEESNIARLRAIQKRL